MGHGQPTGGGGLFPAEPEQPRKKGGLGQACQGVAGQLSAVAESAAVRGLCRCCKGCGKMQMILEPVESIGRTCVQLAEVDFPQLLFCS